MEELIFDYQNNLYTIKELSSKYHMGQEKVRTILKDNGLYIRKNFETRILRENPHYSLNEIEQIVIDNYDNKKWGQKKSGEQFSLSPATVKKILVKNGIKIRDFHTSIQIANGIYNRSCQQYSKNEFFFKNETPDMAWLLGFLASDGNVSKKENLIRIELSSVDKEILEKIKELVAIDNPIHLHENKKGFQFATLSWSCKEHKEDLKKYGIVPNKIYILTPPTKLNENFYIDYIRGYFDGDGTVNLNRGSHGNSLRWSICGASKVLLKWIVEVLEKNGIPAVNIHKDSSHSNDFYSIVYSTNSTKKIFNLLYTKNSIYLKRKKDKFEYLLKNYSIIE